MRHLVLSLAAAFFALPVSAQQACYRQSDCDCAVAEDTLRTGGWQVEVNPGVFAQTSGNPFIVPMMPDSELIEFISACEGELRMIYTDREMGNIGWRLNRVAGMSDSDAVRAEIPDIAAFAELSPELWDFGEGTEIFAGDHVLNLEFGPAPARLILAYAGDPGNGLESGAGSITMRVGPVNIPGFGQRTFWARTGSARFSWAGPSDATTTYIRQVCRCNEVEERLAEVQGHNAIYRDLRENYSTTEDGGVRVAFPTSEVPDNPAARRFIAPMFNHDYDPDAPLDLSENWPCVALGDQVDDGRGIYGEFNWRLTVAAAQEPAGAETGQANANFATIPDGMGGQAMGLMDPEACQPIVAADSDPCSTPDIATEAVRAHEDEHALDCSNAARAGRGFADRIEALRASEATRHLAESADAAGATQCAGVAGWLRNGHLMADSEVRATAREAAMMEDFVAQYCGR